MSLAVRVIVRLSAYVHTHVTCAHIWHSASCNSHPILFLHGESVEYIYIIIHRLHQFSEATAGKQRTPGFAMKMGLIKLPTHDPYSTSHEEDHSMHVCVCLVA